MLSGTTIYINHWPTNRIRSDIRDCSLQQNIRIAAADALSAVLLIVSDRDSPHKINWYSRINEEAQRGLRIATTESIHGSLLIYRELLLHAGMVRIVSTVRLI